MSFLATTGGIAGEDVRDLMVAAVEYRFGQVTLARDDRMAF
jgi:putative transposase